MIGDGWERGVNQKRMKREEKEREERKKEG